MIRGAGGGGKDGGGGGSGRAPVEVSDTLRSRASARVLDLISEGEIVGLVNGGQSIYLDETPVQNADGSYNFTGVTWDTRVGTQAQPYMWGFPSVENTTSVGVEVKAASPVVRTFSNPNLNAVRVVVGVPQLTGQNVANGDLLGATVDIAIDVQSNGGGWVRQDLGSRAQINGKTTSRYQRAYRIELPAGGAPWDVRVVRITADSTSSALQNRTFWDAVVEIVDAKLSYPNSALIGLACDASQFSNIPRRAYDVQLLRVQVPDNYDPVTRVYTGTWAGTFKIAWTDNPAWCFYDLLTSDRYGLGEFIDASQVDKWALYAIGKYCDELVPDGFGGQEPRFTCNVYLQSRAEAYQVMRDMASIFRAMAFWSAGAITAVQDAPADPAYIYAPANVIDGAFNYSGSSRRARHTVALVTWNDPADFYRQKVEYVEDADGIARYGVITTEIAAIGCTSRGQANRCGRWLLFSERLEAETVTFRVGLDGAIARPGQIIKVADPGRAGVRYGGRLTAASAGAVTLDAPVTLTAGQAYTLSALKADGTVMETGVSHSGGTLSALTLSPALPEAPAVGSMWVLSGGAVAAQTFRVVAVAETRSAEQLAFEITALAYDSGKFAAVEQGLTLEPRSISVLTARPATPTNLSVTESLYSTAQGFRSRLTVSYTPPEGATGAAISLQPENGNIGDERIVYGPSVDIADVIEGVTYTVRVYAINALGKRSTAAASTTYTVLGKTAPPENVQNFAVARSGDVLAFTWRHVSDVDLDHYEIRQGDAWRAALPVGATQANGFSVVAPRGGTFLIKAVDHSGIESVSETAVIAPDVSGINVVLGYDDSVSGFAGTHDHTAAIGSTAALTWADPADWDTWATWDQTSFTGGVTLAGATPWSAYTSTWSAYTQPWLQLEPVTEGVYTTQPIDIGYKAACQVALETAVELIAGTEPWTNYTDPWTAYAAPDWTWQGNASGLGAEWEVRTSDDNISWSPWLPFVTGAYTFRYLQLRVTLSTDNPANLPFLTHLVARIDVPDRVEHFNDVAVPLAGVTLTFSPQFIGIQTVQVTLQSATSGDRFTVTNKTTTGVTVKVFDSVGAAKTGVVDVDAFGYGERY